MAEVYPALRRSMSLTRSERQAIAEIQQAQYEGAVRMARGVAMTRAVTHVTEDALDGLGTITRKAEGVMRRTPWATAEAMDLTQRANRALGNAIDDVSRWS